MSPNREEGSFTLSTHFVLDLSSTQSLRYKHLLLVLFGKWPMVWSHQKPVPTSETGHDNHGYEHRTERTLPWATSAHGADTLMLLLKISSINRARYLGRGKRL